MNEAFTISADAIDEMHLKVGCTGWRMEVLMTNVSMPRTVLISH